MSFLRTADREEGLHFRLHRAQVISDDMGGWVLVGEFDGPDARARAYVEHALRGIAYGC